MKKGLAWLDLCPLTCCVVSQDPLPGFPRSPRSRAEAGDGVVSRSTVT